MQLQKLSLHNFRCYGSLNQTFETATNLIDGPNGSGKTALIEAIYWQSTGRSFRHHKSIDLIKHQQEEMTVFSEYMDARLKRFNLGVHYSKKNKKTIKCQGEMIRRQTDIAQQFPVIAIDPGCFLWLDHPPAFRRTFLDWLVFHVKPSYLNLWRRTQKVQQHLNKLLKKGHHVELSVWQQQYAQLAEKTHQMRFDVFLDIQKRFNALIKYFLPGVQNLHLDYKKGWRENDILQTLINKHDLHLRQGFIDVGIHKADLLCQVNDQMAQVYLSRGQKKLLAILMYIVFIEIYEHTNKQSPVICLDDIDSELDDQALELLAEYLQQQPRQLFITTVESKKLINFFTDPQVFHVKQDQQHNSQLST